MLRVQTLYPNEENEFLYICNYQPILDSFGKIIIQVDDMDYQGDSRVLYKSGAAYGWLQFGWGSCSGCDWLQACGSWEEVQELADQLENGVKWFGSAFDALVFFNTHDWEGDYSWHEAEQAEFVRECRKYLLKIVES